MNDPQNAEAASGLPTATQTLLEKLARDMRFMGYVYIIGGALYCLTIIGALIGVPVLISGLRLKDAADSFRSYAYQPQATALRSALEHQAKFFFIQKVLVLIAIGLTILSLLFMFFFIGALVSTGLNNSMNLTLGSAKAFVG